MNRSAYNFFHDGIVFSCLLIAVGVGFPAFCVWLAVRIINRRERWAKQLAVKMVVVFVVYYPLAIGPAFWLAACGWLPAWAARAIYYAYRPFLLVCKLIGPLDDLVDSYINWWLY